MLTWEEITERIKHKLPGETAQWRMAPLGRVKVQDESLSILGFKESAVLVPFVLRESGWSLLLTMRSTYDGVHSAQISFPGGKFEEGETYAEQVAVREAGEELGIHPLEIEIVGRLSPLTIPVSRMRVQPIVAKVSRETPYTPDPREVGDVLEIPMHYLANPLNIKNVTVKVQGDYRMNVPAFDLGGSVIWGATAMMISELLAMLYPDLVIDIS
jgi:8-oxo-dGTP pyrophosphatase MutT (NUDIX family)